MYQLKYGLRRRMGGEGRVGRGVDGEQGTWSVSGTKGVVS